MKHMKWLALLTTLVMVLGMGAAMATSLELNPTYSNAPTIRFTQVPWEDKSIKVWFGILDTGDNVEATFTIDILEQASEKWQDQFNKLDADKKQQVLDGSLMLLDIECSDLELPANQIEMYIQITEPWANGNGFHFYCVKSGEDEDYSIDPLISTFDFGDFIKISMNHFSPFAAYVEGVPVPAPVAPPTDSSDSSGSVPSTGDQSAPAMWLALAAMSAAVVIGFGRKARKA